MKLKIESSDPQELLDFQEFIYSRSSEFEYDEEYKHSPGFNKEPIVVAIIVALGGPVILKTVQTLIKEYFEYKKKKEEEETKRLGIKTKSNDKQIELSVKSGIGWKKITTAELESVILE